MPAPSLSNPDNHFWVNKLVPFKHGSRLFPQFRGLGGGIESLEIEISGDLFKRIEEQWPTPVQRAVPYLAAMSLLVCRYTSSQEVLVAGLAAPGMPLFYCCRCHQDWTARFFLHEIQKEMETVLRHESYSFHEVTGLLGLEDGSRVAELFRIGFATDVTDDPPDFAYPPSLLLFVNLGDGCAHLRLSFDATLYPTDLMEQFAGHYRVALGYLMKDNCGLLGDLDILSKNEKSKIIHQFNCTTKAHAGEKRLHGLFEEQAAKTPDALAVIYEREKLTYQELNERANGLASYLRDFLNVRTGDRVGILVGRSEKMIVGLLGILKAGAAYVPINPSHPWSVVSDIIQNADIRVLLVDSETTANAATFDGEIFVLDVELDRVSPSAKSPDISTDKELAYVIYTSGSTGRPKGVAVEHHAIVNTILWQKDYYGIDESDTNLQMPSFAFDSSVPDIFGFLAAGARLIIPREDLRLDPRYIKGVIESWEVTRLIVTPTYYRILVSELKGLTGLRSITVAGESTSAELVAAHYRSLPGVRLINEYGPTENAVCSTACELTNGQTTVPIGKPIHNVKVFVLDEALRPTPIGVPGEIFLAGAGLARGYLNQHELTADRFIESPLPEYYQGRMYRTGDRACWRSDGILEFQGRIDSQVKLRGFRIELGEIESVLLKFTAVENVAVLCKEDLSGDKYLAAYLEGQAVIDTEALSEFAQKHLPYYMVPDVFTVMHRLPVNLNGKIDGQCLRTVDDFAHAGSSQSVPMTALERSLLGLCEDLFKRSGLGLDDNFFFALGANSLRVMEMVTRVRNEMRIKIDLSDVYTCPTVRKLADRINTP